MENNKIPYDFYEKVEEPNYVDNILYSDTDSLFIKVLDIKDMKKKGYKFGNKENIDKIMNEIVLPIAKKINKELTEYWNEHILSKCNVDNKYNTVEFKTEMLMSDLIFTGVKKRYIYKLWKKEDAYFIPPKIKYAGIELKRSDVARITKEAMMPLIQLILDDFDNKKERLKKASEIINDIKNKFYKATEEYDFELIGIPSKWSFGEYESEPSQVKAARLWNTIVSDTIRPGDKGVRIAIQVNKYKLEKHMKALKHKSKYMLPDNINVSKLNFIFIPPSFSKSDIEKLISSEIVKFDWDEQYDKTLKTPLSTYIEIIKNI